MTTVRTLNTIQVTKEFVIEDGPNREGLFDALRLCEEFRRTYMVLRHADSGKFHVEATIWGAEIKRRSQVWKLKVYFGVFHDTFNDIANEVENYNQLFEVEYNTMSRKGEILRALPEDPRSEA
jgi:hypothetical protein